MSEGSTFIVEFWDSGAKLEGEFTSAKFPALDKCTQIHTFHMDYQGAATMGHGSGLGGAGVTISPIAIEKSLDKISTKLFQYCTSGDSLDKVVIHCFMTGAKGGLVEYKTVTAEVCYIESYGLALGRHRRPARRTLHRRLQEVPCHRSRDRRRQDRQGRQQHLRVGHRTQHHVWLLIEEPEKVARR
ncbi:MAG: type VI secretion system tube protein Hcp [Bryobacterales bacterium]|nr:type VI secretion system tube protein Hcp [Bryobacterales bacterium]